MSASATLFKKVDYELSKLVQDIEMGEIGLPDIQRPFVWDAAKVRDLFDSMYKGFPVGYLLFWSNEHLNNTRQIGTKDRQTKVPRLLIVDGQQRLTSLYAIFRNSPILTKDYRESQIKIAFRPHDSLFEVADAATNRDPEFIPNISVVWSEQLWGFINQFITNLEKSHPLAIEDKNLIANNIQRLYELHKYPFTAMEISSTVSEEQVSEIFVRINSKGVTLNQADFILTLLSVFWEEGRKDLEIFCRATRTNNALNGGSSAFNYFLHPSPAEMLRVCVGLGFKRARLQHVYSILRGKDLETGQFSDERREQQFKVLMDAQSDTLDLTNWHEFLKALMRAGFRSNDMITSDMAVLYSYVMFLIGRTIYGLDLGTLRTLIARWFFMTSLSQRYSGSPESVMETDLARLRGVDNAEDFIHVLERVMRDELTEDFWTINLPNSLETSTPRSPRVNAYYAALSILDAYVLFSDMKVSTLLDPALRAKRSSLERHHLFPVNYLSKIGINDVRERNQAANYAFLEWHENNRISDEAPSIYFPYYAQHYPLDELKQIMYWHALPENWHEMDYQLFLSERRKLMALVIRHGFERLTYSGKG